jgi:hypothetical protein
VCDDHDLDDNKKNLRMTPKWASIAYWLSYSAISSLWTIFYLFAIAVISMLIKIWKNIQQFWNCKIFCNVFFILRSCLIVACVHCAYRHSLSVSLNFSIVFPCQSSAQYEGYFHNYVKLWFEVFFFSLSRLF